MGYLNELQERSKDELVNELYNNRVSRWADHDSDEDSDQAGEKRIPYIGWFWRSTDFVNKRITIGKCSDFIGVMENNKWDYPERLMTEEEATTFIQMLDDAFAVLTSGGFADELQKEAEKKFTAIWDWFQTLSI